MPSWLWFIVALIGYFVLKERINKELKRIQSWLKENKDRIDEWAKVPEIKKAYEDLIKAVKEAGLDKKWSITEILNIVRLAIRLFTLIEEYEKKKEEDQDEQ